MKRGSNILQQTDLIYSYVMMLYNYRYHAYVKAEDTVSVVNKDELKQLVEEIEAADLDENDYDADAWKAFCRSIKEAKKMYLLPKMQHRQMVCSIQ